MLTYEYAWSTGATGSHTVLLFDNGRFNDSDRHTGRWGYQAAQQRYVLLLNSSR